MKYLLLALVLMSCKATAPKKTYRQATVIYVVSSGADTLVTDTIVIDL